MINCFALPNDHIDDAILIDQKYINLPYSTDIHNLFIKSYMGSGKTQYIHQIINTYYNTDNILLISP